MDKVSLLPAMTKRMGKLYDSPDEDGTATAIVSAAVVKLEKLQPVIRQDVTKWVPRAVELIQTKTWTGKGKKGVWCIQMSTRDHALVTRSIAATEQEAWNKVVEELRLQNYRL